MDLTALKQKITQYCEQNQISGVLRVTLGGKTVFRQAEGFADFENRVPFTNDSMFTFYSLSKPFCAIGLLKLKDKGLLELDLHPSRYVPEAVGFDGRVTVRHLLHHTSGLPDFEQNRDFAQLYAPGYAKYAREHLRQLTGYPSYFAPGTDTRYANVNFVICALIIENLSGLPYAKYMEQEVFKPLGAKTAVIDDESKVIRHRVKGYIFENGLLLETEKSHNWLLGAGDIVGTIEDVYCLNKAVKNRLLLSGETWTEVLTPSSVNSFGMGCSITEWHGKRRITHNGGHLGFRTLHVWLPQDDFDLIFLSNSGFGEARADISEMVHETFYGSGQTCGCVVEMDKGYI